MIEVVLLGYRKSSGKDTLGKMLCERDGFVRVAYADKLKEIVSDLFRFNHEQTEGSLKETLDPRYGFSPRYAFQTIGTEHLRSIYPNVWTDYVYKTTIPNLICKSKTRFVITDFRFPNEHQAALDYEKHLRECAVDIKVRAINIIRPGLPTSDLHSSETALDNYTRWDHIIQNDGSIEDLYNNYKQTLDK
jgi:hypothetical protein